MKTISLILNDDVKVEQYPNGCEAFLKKTAQEMHDLGINGCPMGRGVTPRNAIWDLVDRVEKESHVHIEFDVVV